MHLSVRVHDRVRETEKFVRLFTVIQTQIEYALTPTGELLEKLSASTEFQDFSFIQLVKEQFIAGESLEKAWNTALQKYAANSALQAKEMELISAFSESFGSTDKFGQSANCAYFIAQLKMQAEELQKDVHTKSRLYRAVGILSGVFLMILLL